VDWTYQNERLQTTVEIYSEHGQSEYYDRKHPLSYENCSSGTSSNDPHYARDAWVAGQRLGVIASSDDHSASPGRPYKGLAAVYAENLTRTVPYSVTQPGSREVSFTYVDSDFNFVALYYLRVQQVNEVGGRIGMAWSSPIWVSFILDRHCYLPLMLKAAY
jgi:hypothetical protein